MKLWARVTNESFGGYAMKISFSFPLRVLYIAVLVLGLTGFAFAQSSTSEINGVVKDTTGAVISGATIHLIDVATNTQTTTTATNEGTFVIRKRAPRYVPDRRGTYRIQPKRNSGCQSGRGCSVHCEYRTSSRSSSGNRYRLSFRRRCSHQHNER